MGWWLMQSIQEQEVESSNPPCTVFRIEFLLIYRKETKVEKNYFYDSLTCDVQHFQKRLERRPDECRCKDGP